MDTHPQAPTTRQTHHPNPQVGNGPEDPIVGTVAHFPYFGWVEMGTVRGVHRNKGGVIRVEYPGNTILYTVAHGLLFPSAEEAKTYRREAVWGKKKAKTTINPSNP